MCAQGCKPKRVCLLYAHQLLAEPSTLINRDNRQRCVPTGDPCSSSNHCYDNYDEAIGEPPAIITDRADLSAAEHSLRCSERKRHVRAGVTFRDTELGTFLSAGLEIGKDTVIGVGVQIYGKTVIGR